RGGGGRAPAPPAPAAHAQPAPLASGPLSFEAVGDQALDARDIAFDDEGTLWAIDTYLWQMPEGGSTWEEITQTLSLYVLPLGADTLLAGSNAVRRSLDGGYSWTTVHDEGKWLYEAPTSGTLLTGTGVGSGVAYSHDRGATWQPGTIDAGTWVPRAEAFAELPPDHDHPGRIVAGCWGGLSYSDDGGQSWQTSSLWENSGRYLVRSVAVGADGRIYAALFELDVTGLQIAVSEDGGATYTVAHAFGELVGTQVRLFTFEGGADPDTGVLVVVQHDGAVRRSDDGAATWDGIGQVPFEYPSSLADAVVDRDGHLYVSANRAGAERDWVYRTTGPVVTAAAAVEVETETDPVVVHPLGGTFPFRVRLTNATAAPLPVEVWAEVAGPTGRDVLGPVSVTLPPDRTVARVVQQAVPEAAPAGAYTYAVHVGTYPEGATASDAFVVVKEGAGMVPRGGGATAWPRSTWGEPAVERADAAGAADGIDLVVAPNPTRGTVTATVVFASPTEAAVALYDALGRRVAEWAQAPFDAGRHALALDAGGLPAGVYTLRVQSGDALRTARVALLR
ncbi:MAG: T9SS type A sorting domain-containing protein, partial [Rubricoccaceae bacterium]|nr:T9SS type A sorting domain-containing protein [Rubricoccaceae bacterium]